jgi:membrane-bound lytic murein transglycosylase A
MLRISALLAVLLLSGCFFFQKITIKGKGDVKLSQVNFTDLDNWEIDDHKKALQSFIQSCNKFSQMAQNRLIGGQLGEITVGDFRDVCEIAQVVKTMSAKQARNFFENWFKPFLVETRFGNSKGIFTGYYEASLNGSKVKSEKFKYPVYARPKDLASDPYLSRKDIEDGALENKGLELFYVDDKVELFFMHIQGSGRITLPNGTEVRVAYAGRNNQPYTSVGNYMADKGYLQRDKINAATIKEWMRNNLDEAQEVMNVNAAFTFFKIADGEYVVGGQGVPLTAERSLAVDSDVIPYGFPIFVDTNLKNKDGSKNKYAHLLIAQDTGTAIKGTVRGDIFFGHGDDAVEKASYMAGQGKYYILLPINIVDKFN